jgi:phage terminase Nu1 subunit (DNA packaging protein)
MNEIEVSAKDLAKVIGVKDRTVREFADRGLVIRAGRGRYRLVESVRAYCDHLRATAAGRGGEDEAKTLTSERTRLAREQADQTALKNAALRRDLVPAAEVERAWSEILRRVRSGCLAIPSRVRQALAHLTAYDVQAIDAEVRAVLAEIGADDQ